MKKFGLLFLSLLAFSFCFAQDDEVDTEMDMEMEEGSTMEQPPAHGGIPAEYRWQQVEVGEFSDPIPYAPIRQADVMYYHTIWRTIDLREKVNHPLYFPTEVRGTWKSLAQTIFDAIDMEHPDRTEGVLPIYDDDMCLQETPRADIQGNLAQTKPQIVYDEDGEEIGETTLVIPFEAKDVISYNIKEVWYFDKQESRFRCEIITLEPIFEYYKDNNSSYEEGQEEQEDVLGAPIKKRMGTIFYDELRPFLAKQEVFNVKNNAQRLSFDDLLTWKRYFSSFIYKEANTYDREIQEYVAKSRDQRLESEKIVAKLRTFEGDLWEF